MDTDRTGRLFVCARCRDQVQLCSHCDRGQQYCGRACSNASRRERRREAAERYQRSRGGRIKHAARTARWRYRRRSLRGGDIDKVTHQGCRVAPSDASLLACEPPSACEPSIDAEPAGVTAPASAGTAAFAAQVCRRCARPLLPHLRQGWLRASSVHWRGGHDHPT